MDYEKTIRTALDGLLATHGEECHRGERCQARIDGRAALSSLTVLQEERERMQADSRRLDGLERLADKTRFRSEHGWWFDFRGTMFALRFWPFRGGSAHRTVRAAIDATIGEPPSPALQTKSPSAASVELRGDPFFDVWRCSSCGESQIGSSSPAWRWNGKAWEHKCGDPQAGYFPARNFGPPLDRADAQQLKAGEQCECPLREALFDFAQMPTVGADDSLCRNVLYPQPVSNRMILAARAALQSPCPCEGMRQGHSILTEHAIRMQGVEAERDSLRAELATETERAEANWNSLERVKGKFESATAQLTASQERERVLRERLESATEFDLGHAGRVMNNGTYRTHLYIRKCSGHLLPKQPMWKVVDEVGAALCKDGEWEHEPMPSSRDAKFYARARFDTYEDAKTAASALATPEGTRS